MRQRILKLFSFALVLGFVCPEAAVPQSRNATAPRSPAAIQAAIDTAAGAILPRVVAWRRDFHEHPELGNREFRTAKVVADELRSLGLEVRTDIAKTGVVALLKGGKPGPVVALRSDMDALPVTEDVDLPFRSKATADWAGQKAGVMHACGHDNHLAILLGTAHVLSGIRAQLAGSVKFIFQPAEEGAPPGEEGGAELMVKEGVLAEPKVDAIFGLHVFPFETGTLAWRSRGIMAARDTIEIVVRGRQTHGALPWAGVDPIVIGSQIVLGLQTLVSRQVDLTAAPAIVTIAVFDGGVRHNIIPEEVTLRGTLRTYDPRMRDFLKTRIRETATLIAQSGGASARVVFTEPLPVTYNDPDLMAKMEPTLRRVAGSRALPDVNPTTTSEDFSFFQEKVPGVFFFLGVTPKGTRAEDIYPNHSPRFFADEAALITGVRAMSNLAVDYLKQP